MKLQIARRCVQIAVVFFLCGIVSLSLYAHYRSARFVDDPQLMAGLRGEMLAQTIHPLVDSLDEPQAFLDSNKGTLWSMRIFGVSISDPLAAAEMLAASKTIHWPMLASIVIPVILTFLLGRVFCSWICPAYLLFEITGKLRKLLRLAEIEPANVQYSHRNKYIMLAVGLLMTFCVSAPIFALIYPPAVVSRLIHAWIFGTAATAMLLILGIIVAFELFVSPRWWCRSMCPGGALYGLIGWARPVRVKLKSDRCTGCQACIPVCEAGINPITESESIECDNCGVCLNHCGDDALVFSIGLPIMLQGKSNKKQPRRQKLEVSALIAFLMTLLLPATASAHHILGLPHYSYKENYPQRPTLEYPATSGPYDIILTSYPGIPTPGEPANLAFYIKNRNTAAAFTESVTLRVLQTSTFGDNTIILPSTTRPPFDNEFKYHVTFPDDGEYIVELSVMVEGNLEVIPFLMVVGQPSAMMSTVVFAGCLGVVGFVVVRAIQKKRRRSQEKVNEIAVSPIALKQMEA
ncbi:MAG: 4Fe-4S binding protein [Phycisphaerales bacterium]|nr:4Fe-4S binding protein [Phycisphaerales bacterium]